VSVLVARIPTVALKRSHVTRSRPSSVNVFPLACDAAGEHEREDQGVRQWLVACTGWGCMSFARTVRAYTSSLPIQVKRKVHGEGLVHEGRAGPLHAGDEHTRLVLATGCRRRTPFASDSLAGSRASLAWKFVAASPGSGRWVRKATRMSLLSWLWELVKALAGAGAEHLTLLECAELADEARV
jgi:hypothetical protein